MTTVAIVAFVLLGIGAVLVTAIIVTFGKKGGR